MVNEYKKLNKFSGEKMAQKKKKKKIVQKKKRINRSQRIMVVIGIFIILAMVLPSLASCFQ